MVVFPKQSCNRFFVGTRSATGLIKHPLNLLKIIFSSSHMHATYACPRSARSFVQDPRLQSFVWPEVEGRERPAQCSSDTLCQTIALQLKVELTLSIPNSGVTTAAMQWIGRCFSPESTTNTKNFLKIAYGTIYCPKMVLPWSVDWKDDDVLPCAAQLPPRLGVDSACPPSITDLLEPIECRLVTLFMWCVCH